MSFFTKLKIIKPFDSFAFLLNILVLAAAVSLILVHQNNLPVQIPFWYSKAWGVERLASQKVIWLIPSLIIGFLLVNNGAAKGLAKNHPVVAKLLVWGSLFVSLILTFSLYRIILVVL